jgi:hypothetical protein
MRPCLICDEEVDPECFRIQIGGVSYTKEKVVFSPDGDSFEDGSTVKWLCARCASNVQLYIEELGTDKCELCKTTFVPQEAYLSESVMRLEWGCLENNSSSKGAQVVFVPDKAPDKSAHVHFSCACNIWSLPLWSLEHDDSA